MSDRIVSSRPIFLATAVTVIVAAGGIGFTVGATGQNRGKTLSLFGYSLFHMTPASMALFGMALTTSVLVVLFALVSFVSQYDSNRVT